MTMPRERIKLVCPRCKFSYRGYTRGSVNVTLDPQMDPVEEMTVVCPTCGLRISPGGLVVAGDKWEWTPRPSDLIIEDRLITAVRDEMGLSD